MKFDVKQYKLGKIEKYLKNEKLFVVFNQINVVSKKKGTFSYKQSMVVLEMYSLRNKLAKKVLKNSIYRSLSFLINGPIIFVCLKNKGYYDYLGFNFQKFINSNESACFLGLKLNRKFYSPSQLNEVKTLDYLENVRTLHGSLKNFLLLPHKSLSKISK